ncbi:AAA domain-containing protein, partial [Pseudomonas viridiflava]|uniref:AAA domain-containing protein n=1 Tax=Pseudomonas viridiflava TaxID=33069 RepID=UPI0013E06533
RKLVERAAPALTALKPVFMMSPLSVAQFLPPGALEFDLLVMDEASQIQPVDALGAVARAKQVVVVGDPRQLPPTSFFAKLTSGDEDIDEDEPKKVGDVESILGLFTARGLPMR